MSFFLQTRNRTSIFLLLITDVQMAKTGVNLWRNSFCTTGRNNVIATTIVSTAFIHLKKKINSDNMIICSRQ